MRVTVIRDPLLIGSFDRTLNDVTLFDRYDRFSTTT